MGKQEKAAAASTPLLPLQIGRLNPATGGAEVGAGGAERTRIESFPQPNGLGSNFFPNLSTRATPPFGNPLIW